MSNFQTVLRNCLYGININEGPLYFASSTIKEKFNLVIHDENIPDSSGLLNSILYHVCNSVSQQEDIVKARISARNLESRIREKWNETACICSCFLFNITDTDLTKKLYQSGSVLKFNNENEENTQQYTRDIVNLSKSFGIPTISKLIPTIGKPGYMVNVISCASQNCGDIIDHFEVLPVRYSGHHPLFDFRHSIFKSFEETQNVLNIADHHLTVPEINVLKRVAKTYTANKTFSAKNGHQNPFIVVEGLDAVGKFSYTIIHDHISDMVTRNRVNIHPYLLSTRLQA